MDARTPGNCHSLKRYSRLVDSVGPAKGKEPVMLSKLLTAEEALNLGLAAEILPADEMDPASTRSGSA
jgi:enoyl-CoA hydratase/carnithine racemase